MLRSFLALVLLALPALAGTGTLSTGGGPLQLDTPPAWATSIRVRITSQSVDITHAYENLGATAINSFTTDVQVLYSVLIGGTNDSVASHRTIATPQTFGLTAYDGVTDYGGASGVTFNETKAKGATAWGTHASLPTALTLGMRGQHDVFGATAYTSYNATVNVEWEWLP